MTPKPNPIHVARVEQKRPLVVGLLKRGWNAARIGIRLGVPPYPIQVVQNAEKIMIPKPYISPLMLKTVRRLIREGKNDSQISALLREEGRQTHISVPKEKRAHAPKPRIPSLESIAKIRNGTWGIAVPREAPVPDRRILESPAHREEIILGEILQNIPPEKRTAEVQRHMEWAYQTIQKIRGLEQSKQKIKEMQQEKLTHEQQTRLRKDSVKIEQLVARLRLNLERLREQRPVEPKKSTE